jgi:hypothetical protein
MSDDSSKQQPKEGEIAKVDPLRTNGTNEQPPKKDEWPEKKKIASKKDEKDEMSEVRRCTLANIELFSRRCCTRRRHGQEDKQKRAELDDVAKRIIAAANSDADELLRLVNSVATEIRTATSSVTSVPKPLKFLRPHYAALRTAYDVVREGPTKQKFADVLSVLAMTNTDDRCDTLNLKLAGTVDDVAPWGHEYVRRLAAEIAIVYARRQEAKASVDDLIALVDRLVPFYVSHNGEPEACDLLLEIDRIDAITQFVDSGNFDRVCLYLASFANFVPGPEDVKILRIVLDLYRKFNQPTEALRYAMRLHDIALVKAVFHSVPKSDAGVRAQMAYMLGEQRLFILDDDAEGAAMAEDDDQVAGLRRQVCARVHDVCDLTRKHRSTIVISAKHS